MPSRASVRAKTVTPSLPPEAVRTGGAPWRVVGLVVLFVLALLVRVAYIGQAPLDFHPTRQFRSAIIAQSFYTLHRGASSPEERAHADTLLHSEGQLEPPVMESLAAMLYTIFATESLAIPRVVAVCCWLLGGVFLYLLAMRLFAPQAAFFTTALYLFLPFGIAASRSFQPDPLMVALIIAGLLALQRYDDAPSWTCLGWAAGCAAAAIFVKPMAAFFTIIPFLGLALVRHARTGRWWQGLCNLHTALYLGIALLPGAGYYLYGLVCLPSLQQQSQGNFLPGLFLTPGYWLGTLRMLGQAVGFDRLIGDAGLWLGWLLIACALIAVWRTREPAPRALLLACWSGYALFCLAFNYRTSTHNYYHELLLPILALSLGVCCTLLEHRPRPVRTIAWSIVWLVLLAGGVAMISVLNHPQADEMVRIYRDIGDKLNHSGRLAFLTYAYGEPLRYYGKVNGYNWPTDADLEYEQQQGKAVPTAEERLQGLLASPTPPEFFVITQPQRELIPLLRKHYPVYASERGLYVIFDLRQQIPGP